VNEFCSAVSNPSPSLFDSDSVRGQQSTGGAVKRGGGIGLEVEVEEMGAGEVYREFEEGCGRGRDVEG